MDTSQISQNISPLDLDQGEMNWHSESNVSTPRSSRLIQRKPENIQNYSENILNYPNFSD